MVFGFLFMMLSSTMFGFVLQVRAFYCPFVTTIETTLHSPGELRVVNSMGQVTGLVDGKVVNAIPVSTYLDGTVTLSFPKDSYSYDVRGISTGLYGLTVTAITKQGNITVTAKSVSISLNEVHRYTVYWVALSQRKQGVTAKTDLNADGAFEGNFRPNIEVTIDGSVVAISMTDPNMDGTVDILDITLVALAFGTKQADPRWNSSADLDNNGVIDILDVFAVARDYGKMV
jgi:hypothetical protein